MRIRSHRDFRAGVMFVGIGAAFVAFAQQHVLGTPARMGPGIFPTLLGAPVFLTR